MKIARSPDASMMLQAILAAALMMSWQVASKATRDSLFLTAFPASALPSVVGSAAVGSILAALASAKMLRRFGPFRVIPATYLFGAVLHCVEWVLLTGFPRPVSAIVYIHVIALGSVQLSGFWALANERFDPREARRAFGRIAAFGTLGSLAGGVMAERVATLSSNASLLLLLAALQVFCFLLLLQFSSHQSGHPAPPDLLSIPEVISGAPYLVRLAGLVLLAAMSASTLDFLFKSQAVSQFGRGPALSRFFGLYYAVTSVVTFALQVGVSRQWLKRFGPGRTVAALPVAVSGASFISLFVPGAGVVIAGRALEQILRGALFRSGYELFFTPMPPAEKRSAKPIIDIGVERLGDGLAAAAVQLLLTLPMDLSSRFILGFTAVLSAGAAWVALRLDRAYVKVLEKGLASHSITPAPEDFTDDLSRSVISRSLISVAVTGQQLSPAPADPVLERLAELRSSDRVRALRALRQTEPLDAIHIPQTIVLMGRDETAQAAYDALAKIADRIAGQLVDALEDPSTNSRVRKRIPRVLALSQSRMASEGLLRRLGDERFEIRARSARALAKILRRCPEYKPEPAVIFAAVERELAMTRQMGRSHPSMESREDHGVKVNEVLKEREFTGLAHIFALLALVLPEKPLGLAQRALQTGDARLRGVALEYLESVLPRNIGEKLFAQVEAPLPVHHPAQTQEALAKLLDASPSIVARLEELGVDPAERRTAL